MHSIKQAYLIWFQMHIQIESPRTRLFGGIYLDYIELEVNCILSQIRKVAGWLRL